MEEKHWFAILFRAQSEASAAIREMKDPGAMEFSRATITNFSYEASYKVLYTYFIIPNLALFKELLKSHPLLMHCLVASMTKDGVGSIQVRNRKSFKHSTYMYI